MFSATVAHNGEDSNFLQHPPRPTIVGMSSSGRYQSWLLNTVRSQARQLADRIALTARQARLAVVWGTQVALYPIYLLFQGTRVVSRQIRQSAQKTILKLQAKHDPSLLSLPPSDRATQRTLDFAQTLWKAQEDKITTVSTLALVNAQQPTDRRSLTTPHLPSPLRGIATSLDTRSLVLVDPTNRVWDVLTAAQQQQLYRRLIWEVIDYDRAVQRVAVLQHSASFFSPEQRRLSLPAECPQALPLVQRFRRLMGWMQQSPVAIALNVFQEVELAPTAIASTPSATPQPASDPSRASTVLTPQSISSDDSGAWYSQEPSLPVLSESWLTMSDLLGTTVQESQPSGESMLGRSTQSSLVVVQPQPSSTGISTVNSALTPQVPHVALDSSCTKPSDRDSTTRHFSTFSRQSPAIGRASTPQDSARCPPAQHVLSQHLATEQSATGHCLPQSPQYQASFSIQPQNSSLPEHTPDWIDTQAESAGYVKHPLEVVLGWLDAILTWIEALGIAVWKLIVRRSHGTGK
jgi:hypothetical protein